jgi:hypothetical protein
VGWREQGLSLLLRVPVDGRRPRQSRTRLLEGQRSEDPQARLSASQRAGTCFYVGSSRSLATRFRDHLGFGAKGTYALQLVHWAPPLSLQLEFVCARYAEDTPPEVIAVLEDTLWEARRPMFGRKGRW